MTAAFSSPGCSTRSGALVRNALEPLARSSGADDYRDAPKRWADALVELAASKTRIQMQVTSSVETLLDLVGAPGAETGFSLPTPPAQPQRGDPSRWSAGPATRASAGS